MPPVTSAGCRLLSLHLGLSLQALHLVCVNVYSLTTVGKGLVP